MNDVGRGSGAQTTDQDYEPTLAFEIAESERLENGLLASEGDGLLASEGDGLLASEGDGRRDLKARIQHSQKLESLGVLAGAIAHDFNNYLTGILGNAGMVLRKLPTSSDCRPLLEEIEKAAHHAAALSNQMLAYTGRAAAVSQPFDPRALIEEMTPILRISVSKKAALRIELADGLPSVVGDPSQIRQVIMNLITNASDALGSKSGYISLEAGLLAADRTYLDDVDGGAELAEGPYVYLEVSDTGCGMDPAAQNSLYDPSFTTKGPGRGLGMAAVQGIVRDHGGAIKLDTVPGRGTTLKVLLAASDHLAMSPTPACRRDQAWDACGTVLVVDDEQIIREVARNILEDCGYDVLVAEDGRKALEVFGQHADNITAVLLDLTMPELDGAEAFVELRRIRPDVRVVLSSGFDDNDSMIERFMTEEAVAFLKKPYRPAQLIERIRAVTRT